MRRIALLLAGAVLAVAGVVAIGRLNQDQQYRRLLADGDAALAAGQPYLAVEAFSGALAIRADSMAAHYRRGEAYAALGQVLQAERDLREARTLAPDAPEPLEALGRLYDRRGDFAAAAEWYTQAAGRLHDTDARLLYTLALARYRTGALPSAHDAIRRAVAIDEHVAEAHYLLGLIAHDLGHTDEALGALERAIRLRPALAAARQELAALYRELGRPDDETAQLAVLLKQDAQLDRYLALARAQTRSGEHAAALDTLTAAEAVAPGDSRVALAGGRVHLAMAERGDARSIQAALALLERALGGTARRSEGLALYGRALHLAGEAAAAERLLEEAIRTSPVDPQAFGFLADAAEALGHDLVARDALLSLDALTGSTGPPGDRSARARRIGTLSLGTGDTSIAVRFLTLATEAGDHSPGTLALLARALWLDGRRDNARSTLDAALARWPADGDLIQLERSIR